MKMEEYEREAKALARYPRKIWVEQEDGELIECPYIYPSLGLGEAGEALDQIKKALRNDGGILTQERVTKILLELGDNLWYIANLANELSEVTGRKDINLSLVAQMNIDKLHKRRANDTIKGDDRKGE